MKIEDMDSAAAKVAGQISTDPMDTAARQVVGDQRTAVKSNLYNTLLEDPDVAARSQQLGRKAGLPADVVQRNYKEVERGLYLNNVDTLLENNPAVAQFLASPQFAAIAHDDVDNLGAIEQTLQTLKNIGGAGMSGLYSMSAGAVGMARAPVEIAAPLFDPLVGTVLPENPLNRVSQGLEGAQQLIKGIADANMPKAESVAGAGFYSGVASLTRNLATLPLALVNPAAGLTIMSGTVAGEEYGKAREQNLAPIQALSYGVSQGAVEYLTEKIPLTKLIGDLKVGAPLYRVLANQLAAEIPGEQLATILQDLNEWGTLNPDKPFADYIDERPSAMVQTLIATMVGVGGQVSVVKGIEAIIAANQPSDVDRGGPGAAQASVVQTIAENAMQMRLRGAQAEIAERDAQTLTKLTEVVRNSKLAQRDLATFEQFVQGVVQETGVQDVYVNAQTFMQGATEMGVTREQMPQAVQDQLDEALATGADLRIPMEQFASQIAPGPYAEALIDHLKLDPMGMSRAEAQVFMQTQVEQMQAETERALAERDVDVQFRTSIDTVRTTFKDQLDTVNRFTPEVNDSYANMLANFYGVTAAKLGTTPEMLAQRYPLQVKAEGVASAAQTFGQGRLPASNSLNLPPAPAVEDMQRASRVESVPLQQARATQSRMEWDRFESGDSPGALIEGYDDRPVAVRREDGEYLIFDGHHRTAKALSEGVDTLEMYVVDAKDYAPEFQGRAPSPDDGGATTNRIDVDALAAELEGMYPQGTGNRGQIAFGDDITQVPSIITLLKGADLSTFLHESGHFFLEVQLDLAARIGGEAAQFGPDTLNAGEQELLRDAQALLDWFGVSTLDEWFNLPMEEKRVYHEQFARGFESYLFEGNAPSIELQGLFQRFRAWMVRVYKDLKALNVELTDEVRGVMDRMLATTEQIELAEKGRSMFPLFESAVQAGMTSEEFAAYQDLGAQATEDAIQDLQARALRDMQWISNARGREIKRLKKESAARRSEVRMEARREIMSQPIYQAWRFLTGKLSDNDKAAVAPVEPRKSVQGEVDPEVDDLFVAIAKLGGLNREAAESELGWDPAERSPMPLFGKYVLRREGGLSVDGMAEALAQHGYVQTDEHGKHVVEDLESKFDKQYRGEEQFSTSKDYSDVGLDLLAGEGADLENVGAGRLDLGSLRTMDIPEELVTLLESMRMTAREGIHPDLVAESFNFTSGDELVRTLALTENPSTAIEGLTDQKMLERYGDLASPEAIQRAADAAIHNETRARFVAAELNALQKATGKPKILASAARQYASAMIGRLLVRNVKPSQYAAAEVRAAKAAEKAMRAGDTATAAVQKRNQLMNTYATRAAHNAQQEIEQALRYLKKFDNDGNRRKVDADYLDQIDVILERFDLRVGQSLKSIDKRKALAKWIAEQEEMGLTVELPEKVEAEAFRQSYKDLTVEEMRGLVDSIKQIEHLGRLKEKLLTAQDSRQFAEIVQGMVTSIAEHADGKRANNRTRDTLGNRAARLFKGFVASHRKVASLARELDGFQDAGPVWTYLIKSMNEAGDREATMRAEATAHLAGLIKPVMAEGRMGGKGQFFPTLGVSLNRGEQLAIALNSGNAGNLQRLLDGRGWTLTNMSPVLQNLTAADWQFVQSVWDFFESYRPLIAAKERRVMGKEPEWVEPQPLNLRTKDGQDIQLRGGYYPVMYDPGESGRAEQFADAEQAKQMMQGAFVAATTRRSFTKSRAESVTGRPLALTWDALFRGVNDVIHDLTWHEWVIDANRIIRNEKIDKAIRSTYGAEVVQQFKASVRDIAAGDVPNQDALSKVLTPLRSGAAVAGLGFNLMNAAIQPLGLTQSMVRVGPKWVLMGINEWAHSPVGLVKQVHGKSEFMRNRARTMQRELNEIQSVVQGKGAVREKIDAVMFIPMQSLQLIADLPTWWGAYQKSLAGAPLGMNEEMAEDLAIKQADQAVIDSQSGGQVKDLSLIQRGGPMQKLFTVFYGYFSASYNLGVERAKATNFRKPLDVMHLAADFLLLYSVPAVLASMLKDVLQPGGDDEDPEELARKLIGEQISYLMGTMVGLREITGAVQFATGTRQFNMSYGGPAGLRFFQELDKLGQQIGQGELDRALVRSTVNVGGVVLHLPSAQINRTIDGIIAISEGKTVNPGAAVFGPSQELK